MLSSLSRGDSSHKHPQHYHFITFYIYIFGVQYSIEHTQKKKKYKKQKNNKKIK